MNRLQTIKLTNFYLEQTQIKQKLNKTITDIPRTLNRNNINQAILDYMLLLKNVPLIIESNNVLEMMTNLKRKHLNSGPYPNVSLFESANRIMTDLTILFGIRDLFNGAIKEIDFNEYKVEFGHDNFNDNDISANNGKVKLIGEVFNVAKTFFQPKKTITLKKMRKQVKDNDILLLIYNSDAVSESYSPRLKINEFHHKVNLNYKMIKRVIANN